MVIYDGVLLSLKPGVKIENSELPAGRVWIAFQRYVLSEPGCEELYWIRDAGTDNIRLVLALRDEEVWKRFYDPHFTIGMRPMNGYLAKEYVHNIVQEADVLSMKEIKLCDLPPPRARTLCVTTGSLFGAHTGSRILQNRRGFLDKNKPREVHMGGPVRFLGPWLPFRAEENRPLEALDIFTLPFEESQVVELINTSSPTGLAWGTLRRGISNAAGFSKLYWGCQEEHPTHVQVMIEWKSPADQVNFNSSTLRTRLWKDMKPYLSKSVGNVPVWSIPHLIEPVVAPRGGVLEILTFYLPDPITEADRFAFEYYFREFNMSFTGTYIGGGKENPQYVRNGGWINEPVPLGNSTATAYVAFCGWKGPEYEAVKCNGFPVGRRMMTMATVMIEAMAMLGVESRHILLNSIDTVESLRRDLSLVVGDHFAGFGF